LRRDDLLDLNDILQHPGRELSVEVTTELADEEDLDLVNPLDGNLDLVSTGNLLLIKGQFCTRAVVECARCLGPLEVDVEFEVDEQFDVKGVPSSLDHTSTAKVDADEPYPLFEGNELMVEALLRQNLLLNYPVQPLCSFGWEGECPIAKERLGEKRQVEVVHPEFEKLKNLVGEDDA
jgi:uncharacterized protein